MSTLIKGAVAAALLAVPVFAADTPDFAMWKAAELKTHEAALSGKIGADHSARETLADYGDHRFRMLYRDADGNPEEHASVVDVVFVQGGQGTLMLGGTMTGRRAGSGAGEYVGTKLEGGTLHPLAPGDIVHIPATVPHSFLVPKGQHLSYVLLKFPAK
jgi:mannose-6-phosphate isomerase-like protein (cupin superfamily)